MFPGHVVRRTGAGFGGRLLLAACARLAQKLQPDGGDGGDAPRLVCVGSAIACLRRQYGRDRLAGAGRIVLGRPAGELDHFGNPGVVNSDLCVRTKSLKYRRTEREEQLYDLELDPGETVNRLADPAYAAAAGELRDILDEYLERGSPPSNRRPRSEEPARAPTIQGNR